jgi:hypothetical protein
MWCRQSQGADLSPRAVNRSLIMLIQLMEIASPDASHLPNNSQMQPPLINHQRRLFVLDSLPTDQDSIMNRS